MQRAAIIDLGTNTFHILIVEWQGNQYKILDKLQIPVKLGKGAFEVLRIREESFARGLAAMIEFKSLLDSYNIPIVLAYGTSALRNAHNGEEFKKEAERIIGFPIKIIGGEEEAELIFNGVRNALPLGEEPHLIMDIGGGSVEFIIANQDHIHWKKSYEIGAARLIERYADSDPLNIPAITSLQAFLEDELDMLWKKGQKYQVKTLVGASGSFETVAGIEMQLYHSTEQIFPFLHHIISLKNFENICKLILKTKKADLKDIPGMPEFRVEMIQVSIVMIHYVFHRLKLKNLIVSDFALKEGVMFKIINEALANWHTIE